ncbi:MAG: D-isomer specific 2-hydroxyacid dehydrogenase family protein [Microbacteriaceae bacterium]
MPRPTPGSIAVMPDALDVFVDAVVSAGGTVAPLSHDTRGIVWLSEKRADELAEVLRRYPAIEWVQLPWAGVDAFGSLLAARASESPSRPLFTSAKGTYSEPVAEHALALILATLRQLPQKARSDSWAERRVGTSLYGRRVVIVGAGGIAVELMRLLAPFEADVTIIRRTSSPLTGATRTVTAAHLDDVLADADVVVLAAASTGETAHLIGAPQLAIMKPSAVLVNIARGALIDTDALTAALRAGTIAGAGLDVTDPEPLPDGHALWTEPTCIITSHSADTPEMTAPLLAARIRANVEAFLDHGRFVGIVDLTAGY